MYSYETFSPEITIAIVTLTRKILIDKAQHKSGTPKGKNWKDRQDSTLAMDMGHLIALAIVSTNERQHLPSKLNQSFLLFLCILLLHFLCARLSNCR